jgi:hypothetical protein
MENRNGLVVNAKLTEATGTAEERAAIEMLKSGYRANGASQWAPTRGTTRATS